MVVRQDDGDLFKFPVVIPNKIYLYTELIRTLFRLACGSVQNLQIYTARGFPYVFGITQRAIKMVHFLK